MKSEYKAKNVEDLFSDFIRIMTNDKGNAILAYTEFLVDILGWFLGNYTDTEQEKKEQERQRNLSQEEQKENAEKQRQIAEQQQKDLLEAIKNAANEIKNTKTGSPEAEDAKKKALDGVNKLGDDVAKAKPTTLNKLAEIIAKQTALEHNNGADPLAANKKEKPQPAPKQAVNQPPQAPNQAGNQPPQVPNQAVIQPQPAPKQAVEQPQPAPKPVVKQPKQDPKPVVNQLNQDPKPVVKQPQQVLKQAANPEANSEGVPVDTAEILNSNRSKVTDSQNVHVEQPKQEPNVADNKSVKREAGKREITDVEMKLAHRVVNFFIMNMKGSRTKIEYFNTTDPQVKRQKEENLCRECVESKFFDILTNGRDQNLIVDLQNQSPIFIIGCSEQAYYKLKHQHQVQQGNNLINKVNEKHAKGKEQIENSEPNQPVEEQGLFA